MEPQQIIENIDKKKLEKLSAKDLMELVGKDVETIGIRTSIPAVIEGIHIHEKGIHFILREKRSGNKIRRKPKKVFIKDEKERKPKPKKKAKKLVLVCEACHTKNSESAESCRHCRKSFKTLNEEPITVFDLPDFDAEASDGTSRSVGSDQS